MDGDDDGWSGLLNVRSVRLVSSAADSAYWEGACSNVQYLVEHFYLTCDYPKYAPEGGGTGRDISVEVAIDGLTGTLAQGFSYIDDSGCVGACVYSPNSLLSHCALLVEFCFYAGCECKRACTLIWCVLVLFCLASWGCHVLFDSVVVAASAFIKNLCALRQVLLGAFRSALHAGHGPGARGRRPGPPHLAYGR